MRQATIEQLVHAVQVAGTVLGVQRGIYCAGGAIAVPLDHRWVLVISTDDAERLRLRACLEGRVVATLWVFAGDDDRLAELASSARGEAALLTA